MRLKENSQLPTVSCGQSYCSPHSWRSVWKSWYLHHCCVPSGSCRTQRVWGLLARARQPWDGRMKHTAGASLFVSHSSTSKMRQYVTHGTGWMSCPNLNLGPYYALPPVAGHAMHLTLVDGQVKITAKCVCTVSCIWCRIYFRCNRPSRKLASSFWCNPTDFIFIVRGKILNMIEVCANFKNIFVRVKINMSMIRFTPLEYHEFFLGISIELSVL